MSVVGSLSNKLSRARRSFDSCVRAANDLRTTSKWSALVRRSLLMFSLVAVSSPFDASAAVRRFSSS